MSAAATATKEARILTDIVGSLDLLVAQAGEGAAKRIVAHIHSIYFEEQADVTPENYPYSSEAAVCSTENVHAPAEMCGWCGDASQAAGSILCPECMAAGVNPDAIGGSKFDL